MRGNAKVTSTPLPVKDLFKVQFTALVQNKHKFDTFVKTVYGNAYNRSIAENLRQSVLRGDFNWLPRVRFLDNTILQGANGAYNKASETIFLNNRLKKDCGILASTFIEEVGHHIDTLLSPHETPGNEGEIFRQLLAGEILSASELMHIRGNDDLGWIFLEGRHLEVEFWNPVKAVKKAAKAVADAVGDVVEAVAEKAVEIAEATSDAVEGFFENIGDGDFKGAFRALRDGLDRALVQAPTKLLNRVLVGSAEIFYGVTEIFGEGAARSIRRGIGGRLMEFSRTLILGAWETGTGAARNIVEGIGTIFGGIGKLFSGDWKGFFKDLGSGLLKIFIQTPIDALLLGSGTAIGAIQTLIYVETLGRKLNPRERDELYRVFRDSVDYERVRLKMGRSGVYGLVNDRPFTLGNTIYMKDTSGLEFLPTLVHEMVHV